MDILLTARRIKAARLATGYQDPAAFAKEINWQPHRYLALEAGRLPARDYDVATLAEIARLTSRSIDFLVTGRA